MTTDEKNKLFTEARQQLKIAMMFADSLAESPGSVHSDVVKFTNSVAKANELAQRFRQGCEYPLPRGVIQSA